MDYFWFILFAVLVLILIQVFIQRRSLQNERNLLAKLIEDGNMLYSQVVNENRSLKEIKHDYKKIKQIESEGVNLGKIKIDSLVDLIINTKMGEAKEKNIDFTYSVDDALKINVSVGECVSLFTNLLDNAIEAAEKTDDARIDVSVSGYDFGVVITVENSKLISEKPMDNLMDTTKPNKEEHGFGVGIIKKIVEKNHGSMVMEDLGATFYISITLKLMTK